MAKHELHQFDLLPVVAKVIIDEIGIESGAPVFEVGPGLGALTAELLRHGAQVHAVETDPERVSHLRERFADELSSRQLQLLQGDAATLLPLFHEAYRIVANPPFQLTAQFLRQWLLDDLPSGPPAQIDLVLQRQAVSKWLASEQEQTRSSVLLKLWGSAKLSRHLDREDVEPPSHVDLCCLQVQRHDWAPEPERLRAVDALLDHGFAGPKTVREALKKICTNQILKRQSKQYKWQADEHPRTLSPEAWLGLADFLRSIKKI